MPPRADYTQRSRRGAELDVGLNPGLGEGGVFCVAFRCVGGREGGSKCPIKVDVIHQAR